MPLPRFVYDWRFVVAECAARLAFLPAILGTHFGLSVFVRTVLSKDWENYSFPYQEKQQFSEVVATIILAVMAVAALGGGVTFLKYGARWRWHQVGEESFLFLLGLSLAAEFTYLICDITKKMVGRPRPDYLSRCFHGRSTEQWLADHGWSDYTAIPPIPDCEATNITEAALKDGRMSFPSAHTAMSFCFIGFCALWIYAKMCMVRNTGAWRLLVPAAYLIIALVIAISRTADYRHHPTDVWAGAALGLLVAYISYVFYFPLQMRPLAETVYRLRRDKMCKVDYRDPAKVYKDAHNSFEAEEEGEDFRHANIKVARGFSRTSDTETGS